MVVAQLPRMQGVAGLNPAQDTCTCIYMYAVPDFPCDMTSYVLWVYVFALLSHSCIFDMYL